MADGYVGYLLKIDLTNQLAVWDPLPEDYRTHNLSGKALAAQLLWDHTTGSEKALSGENVLVIAAALLTGTGAPASRRFDIASLSPKDDLPAFSNCGGNLGLLLKKAGCDALLIKGKAPYPQWLEITHREVQFRDARSLWGMGTSLCREQILQHQDAASVCIGPAGENLVKFASVLADGRSTGRAGLGAVLGWKNLKAITVSGTGEIPLWDSENLTESNRKWYTKLRQQGGTPAKKNYCRECPLHCSKHNRQENPILEELGMDVLEAEAAMTWAGAQGYETEHLYEKIVSRTGIGEQLAEGIYNTKAKGGKRRNASREQIAKAFHLSLEEERADTFCRNFAEAISACGQCLFTVKALEPGAAEVPLLQTLECITGKHWNLEMLISLGACSRNLEKQLKKRFQK